MFLLMQKLISLRDGGWVVLAWEVSLHHIIIDFMSVGEETHDQRTQVGSNVLQDTQGVGNYFILRN